VTVTVNVALGDRSYPIHIGAGLLARAGALLVPLAPRGRLAVVTDANVAARHLAALTQSLNEAGIAVDPIVLPAGEATKNWANLQLVTEKLLALGVERGDAVVAFGGGVVGDLTGFAASILRRGCRFVQIPTTLLSQVDSSVGGKTAINAAAGKNLVGAFYQPSMVIIDPDLLDTLPARELRAGYAEVVKYGLIDDFTFFEWLESNAVALLEGDPQARVHAIATSCRAKAATVAADEHETSGRRALLNLGHTFGHALEAETGFSDRLLHGEGVAIGMALAFGFSATTGRCSGRDAARVAAHLASVGLPVLPRSAGISATGKVLATHMLQDKKMSGGRLAFILAHGIGQAFVDKSVLLADVEAFLDAPPSWN